MDFLENVQAISESPLFEGYGSGSTPASFAPTRFLDIRYSNILCTSYVIKDQRQSTELFKVKISSGTNSLTFKSVGGQEVGSAKNRVFSSKIDIAVDGKGTVLEKSDQGKDSMEFQSLACPGTRRVWRDAGTTNGLDMVCVDESGTPLAKAHFSNSWTSVSKFGRIELADSVATDGLLMNELVITGLATAQMRLSKLIGKVAAVLVA